MSGSEAHFPQLSVVCNGFIVPGVLDVEISKDNFGGANRYRFEAALQATGSDVWAADEIVADLRLSFDGNWLSMIVGPVDHIEIDIEEGIVRVEGRDLTSLLMKARIQETFENQTASQIASSIALRRGLDLNVTESDQLVGRAYGGDHSQLSLDQFSGATTEWDLLIRLADAIGYDVWVDGWTLNFSPLTESTVPLVLTPPDCMSLRLERTLPLSALSVTVKSWDSRSGKALSQTATSSDAVTKVTLAADYVIIRPNLTASSAAAYAQRTLSEMTRNKRVITFDMPGDLTTAPRQPLVLAESGTDFDGSYVITSVERRLSFRQGFIQSVEARTPPWTSS